MPCPYLPTYLPTYLTYCDTTHMIATPLHSIPFQYLSVTLLSTDQRFSAGLAGLQPRRHLGHHQVHIGGQRHGGRAGGGVVCQRSARADRADAVHGRQTVAVAEQEAVAGPGPGQRVGSGGGSAQTQPRQQRRRRRRRRRSRGFQRAWQRYQRAGGGPGPQGGRRRAGAGAGSIRRDAGGCECQRAAQQCGS